MRLAAFILLLACGAAYAQNSAPAGLILAASVATITRGTELEMPALAGMELRPGYRISSGKGEVRFAFCPDRTEQTLLPGHVLTIPAKDLPQTPGWFSKVDKIATCNWPAVAEQPLAGSSTGQAPASQGSRGSKVDLLSTIEHAQALARGGDEAGALVEYQKIDEDYPGAAWTRGVIARLANREPKGRAGGGGKTYALLVGISNYPKEALPPNSGLGNLRFADADALSFRLFLQSKRGGSLPDEQVTVITNEKATRAAIDAAVEAIASEPDAGNNTLIIAIASHGHEIKQGDGFIPYIVTADSYNEELKTTGYPMADFRKMLESHGEKFHRLIAYLDFCEAGYVGSGFGAPISVGVKQVFYHAAGHIGVLMAAKMGGAAYELPELGHGAFSYGVLAGLNGGAPESKSREIAFDDLSDYVKTRVKELTGKKQFTDEFTTDVALVVLDDTTRGPGIELPPAPTPTELAAVRGKKGSGQPAPPKPPGPPRATSEFETLARKDPLAAVPLYRKMLQDSQISEERKRQSAEALRVSLEDHGQQILLQYLRGEQARQTRETFEQGARYFEEALKLAPLSTFDESRMLFCQGRALVFEEGQSGGQHYEEAARLLERAILLDPTRGYAYNALGIAYLQQVRQHPEYLDRAIAAFHDAIRYAPDWAYPVHNLALAYTERGDFAAAEREYRQAMKLAPHYSYLPYNLALLYQRLNRLDEAEKLYRAALGTAEKARQQGYVPESKPWRERDDILNALGTLAAARHKNPAALKLYQEALADNAKFAPAQYNLAVLLSRTGRPAEAEVLWRAILNVDADSVPARVALARDLARRNKPDDAIAEYAEAVQAAPENTGARRELAKLYEDQDLWGLALAQMEQARKSLPSNPEIQEEFGDIAAHLGRSDEALAAYQDAARLLSAPRDHKRVAGKIAETKRDLR